MALKHKLPIDYPVVYIVWEDHHASGGWQSADDLDHTPGICHSIGWLIKEDKKAITIAGSQAPETHKPHGNTQFILKRDITKRFKL